MLLIDRTDAERRCQEYLEGLVVKIKVEDVVLCGDKHLAQFNNFYDYHEVAQSIGKHELISLYGFLNFVVDVPVTEENTDLWTFRLVSHQCELFKNKYGAQYEIIVK